MYTIKQLADLRGGSMGTVSPFKPVFVFLTFNNQIHSNKKTSRSKKKESSGPTLLPKIPTAPARCCTA